MKVNLMIAVLLSGVTLLSCKSGDCTNGIQDGKETGIDCGGECPKCVTTSAPVEKSEENLTGKWMLKKFEFRAMGQELSYIYGYAFFNPDDPYLQLDEDSSFSMTIPPHFNMTNNASSYPFNSIDSSWKWFHDDLFTFRSTNNTTLFLEINHHSQDSLVMTSYPNGTLSGDTTHIFYFEKAP